MEKKIGVSTNLDKSRSYLEAVYQEVRNWMVLGGPYTEYKANAVKQRLVMEYKYKPVPENKHRTDENADWYLYYFEHERTA